MLLPVQFTNLRCKSRKRRVHISRSPGKKTPGCRDTHGTHGDTRGHTDTRITQTKLTTKVQANPHSQRTRQLAPAPGTARPRDDRIRGRLNSRSPGADRSPRPTQKRPPPANPTLPPPAPKLKNSGGSRDTHWTHGKHRSRRRTSQPTPVPTPAARLVHTFTTHQNVHSQAFTSKRHAGHIGRDRNSRHL